MTTTIRDTGCCPVCDRVVPRILTPEAGALREVYACPDHGAIGYGAQPVTLRGWIHHLVAASKPAPTLESFPR